MENIINRNDHRWLYSEMIIDGSDDDIGVN